MAHASIFNGKLIADSGEELTTASAANDACWDFTSEIKNLQQYRGAIPSGWHRHYNEAIRSLNAVACQHRNSIEISKPSVVLGSLRLSVMNGASDRVVHGILKRLQKQTACTCQKCGRMYGAAYRESSDQTLCSRCHAERELADEVSLWLGSGKVARRHREQPLIEYDQLPSAIQSLTAGNVRQLTLVSGTTINYVTPSCILANAESLDSARKYLLKQQRSSC